MKRLCYAFISVCVLPFSCNEIRSDVPINRHEHLRPLYDSIYLKPTSDTIHFPLTGTTYHSLKSFNLFTQYNIEYLAFFDDRSASINIYEFKTASLKKRLSLKDIFKKQTLFKTTVYVKNFDSIYVNNRQKLHLIDKMGKVIKTIDFLEEPPFAWATFENQTPPIVKGTKILTAVRPYVKETSMSALRKWKVLYEFDLQMGSANLHYNLPPLYQENIYGYHFMDYSYCYNNRGHIVFSFSADSNIYETNLTDFHNSYYSGSRHQTSAIQPLKTNIASDQEKSFRHYLTQDSYGSIFFDPVYKRYLRVVKGKITREEFDARNRKRKYRFIILNEKCQIIAESPIPDGILYNTLTFSKEGAVFARTRPEDEYTIHFVRLEYSDSKNNQSKLVKN